MLCCGILSGLKQTALEMTIKEQCVIRVKTAGSGVELPNGNPGSTTYQHVTRLKLSVPLLAHLLNGNEYYLYPHQRDIMRTKLN